MVEIITDVLATKPDWRALSIHKKRDARTKYVARSDIEKQRLVGQQALNRALKHLIAPLVISHQVTGSMSRMASFK